MMDQNKPFFVCEEMQKLRDQLDNHGIEWQDKSEHYDDSNVWICRTWFTHNNIMWSVVHGFGSYGGIYPGNEDKGLLELMVFDDGGGENPLEENPMGFLTADNILKLMGLEKKDDQM